MAYTKFGELVRILRIKHHEVMGDTAKALQVSLPFLSSVENGKKNVPEDWIEKLALHYALSPVETQELAEAAEASKTQYKIRTAAAGSKQRRAAMQFARSFDAMDDDTAEKILELLHKKQ